MIDGAKVKELRDKRDWTQKELAKEAGLKSYQLIGQIERGENLTSKLIYKIAGALRVPPSSLDEEISDIEPISVPIVGYVGAGAEAHFYADGDNPDEYVDAPPGTDQTCVAVEIRGNSLGSMFDKWLVFYNERHDPPRPELLYQMCVVGLADGRVLVKELRNGSIPGHFHLLSQTEGMIENVVIEWAAKVRAIVQR